MTWLVAGSLGLLGSAHCVAMCGPLVVAVGAVGHTRGWRRHLSLQCSYHAGRLVTYMLLGATAAATAGLLGLGRVVALAGGAILIAAAVLPAAWRRNPPWTGPLVTMSSRAAAGARRLHAISPVGGRFAAGIGNGLLPCGMVYAALAVAAAAGSVANAMTVMAAFGLGTTPALVAVSMWAATLRPDWRRRLTRLAPLALAAVGILLVARGLTPVASAPADAAASPAALHRH